MTLPGLGRTPKGLLFVAVVLVVTASIGSLAMTRADPSTSMNSSTACSFDPPSQVIPAVSNATAFRIAETSTQFMSLTQGKSVAYSGAAASWYCNTVESIDANFIVTASQGAKEDVVVSMAVGPGNVPNGIVIGVNVLPAVSFGGPP